MRWVGFEGGLGIGVRGSRVEGIRSGRLVGGLESGLLCMVLLRTA